MTTLLLALTLLAGSCADDHLAWDAPEPGAVYRVEFEGVTLGETQATSWPIGCASGIWRVTARDAAGNVSEPAYYAEGGPCAIGCEQRCVLTRPDGSCAASLLPPGSPCCPPLVWP